MIISIFFILFGVLIGSYLNVLIYRLPRELPTVAPRSCCTNCEKIIPWYENIPILSYLFLRGRCSKCSSKISLIYPFSELFIGFTSWLFMPESLTPDSLLLYAFYFSTLCCFYVHFIVDLQHKILPDEINIYLAISFLLYALLFKSWQHWLIGGLIGFAFTYGVTWVFYKLKGQIGLGGGDIKLYGALGLFLGPLGIFQNIFLSCALGSVVGVILILFKIMKRENPIPFGPFIIVIASLQIYQPKLVEKFLSFIMI